MSETGTVDFQDVVAWAKDLCAGAYGISGDVEPLYSYEDVNFRVSDAIGPRYVLKWVEAGRASLATTTVDVLRHLEGGNDGLVIPRVVEGKAGRPVIPTTHPDGRDGTAWLITFIPGKLLADVRPRTTALFEAVGRTFGILVDRLEGFDVNDSGHEWDVESASAALSFVDRIEDTDVRRISAAQLERFRDRIRPRLDDTRRRVIHGDANDYNIIVDQSSHEPGYAIGVIDFGDMVYSRLIYEPAIAAAYCLLRRSDPVEAAVSVLRGFNAIVPVTEVEAESFVEVAKTRLAFSAAMSAKNGAQGDEYTTVHKEMVSEALIRLDEVWPDEAAYLAREACGMEPCPASKRVVGALTRREGETPHIFGKAAADRGFVELDCSVSSSDPLVGGGVSAAAALERIERRIADEGAAYAVGRYDEVRVGYVGEQFVDVLPEGVRHRTVHMGIDLFADAGQEVFAPIPGVVFGLNDNGQPFDYGPTIVLEHEIDGAAFYTLYGHLSRESLQRQQVGDTLAAGDLIGWLGDMEVNGGWPPHVHFQLVVDMLGKRGTFRGVASPDHIALWRSICPDPNLVLRLPGLSNGLRPVKAEEIIRRRSLVLGPSLSVSYRRPLNIIRGEGCWLIDTDGQRYIDCVNNVAHVGHCHPRVVDALTRQASILNTNTRYLHEAIITYAERLAATLPKPLEVCYFVNSGTEANELALRLAEAHTGRSGVVAIENGYHGNSAKTVAISSYKFDGPGGWGRPDFVRTVPVPDTYRGIYRNPQTAGGEYAEFIGSAFDELEAAGHGAAAFIAESIPGCAGQICPPAGYLEFAFAAARSAGAVCIADEVQVGFGRVGDAFWGFEVQGVVPDIVTMGKPIGAGHPMGAVVTTRAIAESFANGMEYFNTFGGNPVSCAVGLAVLDVIEDENLQLRASDTGRYLREGLRQLQHNHVVIGDVRGVGLFIGVELVTDRLRRLPAARQAAYVVERMKDFGVLLSTDGPDHNVIKIKPPLVFSTREAGVVLDRFERVLAEDEASC